MWQVVFTFSLVSIIWIFFRAPDFSTAFYILSHLTSDSGAFLHSLTSISGIKSNILMGTGMAAPAGVPIACASIVLLEGVDYLRAHGRFAPIMQRIPRVGRLALADHSQCLC